MALKATIFKARLEIADTARHYYRQHTLTLARHPSETLERMMVRLVAFIHHANPHLQFAEGLCQADQADLWQLSETGTPALWIEIGTPDEKHLRKITNNADRVIVYCYGGQAVERWLKQSADFIRKRANLHIIRLPSDTVRQLTKLAQRQMCLQCTVTEDHIHISDDKHHVDITYIEYGSC